VFAHRDGSCSSPRPFVSGKYPRGVGFCRSARLPAVQRAPFSLHRSASFARARLTIADRDPSGRRSRYMPDHLASGTMPSGKGFASRLMGLVSVTSGAPLWLRVGGRQRTHVAPVSESVGR
jgi:hypothetical protein